MVKDSVTPIMSPLPLPTLAALIIGAASVAMLSAAEKRLWAGGGALYAGALVMATWHGVAAVLRHGACSE